MADLFPGAQLVALVALGLTRAEALAEPVESLHWVEGGGADESTPYCGQCAWWIAKHLRRHPLDRTALPARRGGGPGWGFSGEDSPRWCEGCGIRLEVSLLSTGVEQQLDFVERGEGSGPDTARSLLEVLDARPAWMTPRPGVASDQGRLVRALAGFAIGARGKGKGL